MIESDLQRRQRQIKERRRLKSNAGQRLTQLRDQAGKALTQYDQVNLELADAMDEFGAGNYGDWTAETIARKAGRIQRLARQLKAADQIEYALEEYQQRRTALEEVMAD